MGRFSGDVSILDKAKEMFRGLVFYGTEPDSSTEGNYGRDNPFLQ